MDYRWFTEPTIVRVLVKVTATIVLSIVFFRWFEVPARKYLARPATRRFAYSSFVVSSILVGAVGLTLWKTQYLDSSIANASRGGIVINDEIHSPCVVLYGDSLASMYGKTLADMAKRDGFRLHVMSVAGANPFPGSPLFQSASAWLEQEKPDCIILAAFWTNQGNDYTAASNLLSSLKDHTSHLIVLGQPPILPDRASRESIREHGFVPVHEDLATRQQRRHWCEFFRTMVQHGISFVDIASEFENANGDIIYCDDRCRQLYQDYLHLSGFGSAIVGRRIAPIIAAAIRQKVKANDRIDKSPQESVNR